MRATARGAVLMVLCIMAHLAAPASPVVAHAFLESSDPIANAVLPTAPQSITMTFTEPLETSYSRAELFDETGAQVPGAISTIGPQPRTMTVEIPPGLGNGTYSLLWRTLSTVDGHTAQGYLPFTVGTEADVRVVAPPAVATTSGALPEWTLAAARWLALLGMAMVVAVWPVWLLVVRPAISPAWQLGPKLTRRVRRYATAAFAFSLLANLVALAVQAAAISGPADLLTGLTTTLGDTRYGTWWLVRVGVLLVFAAVLLGTAWWWPWRRRPATLLALVASAALPLPFSMISHAGAEPEGQATAVAFNYVHLLGASLWAGGLLFLVVALAPTVGDLTAAGRRVVLGRALPRFSVLALIAWSVMGFTGLYSAWLQVGNIPALTGTPYGQTLILKLILIVPLLALGAFNLAVVTRKLRSAETEERVDGWSNHLVSALIAEAVIVTLLLGVVGMLIGTPPARQVMEQQAGSLRIALDAAGQTGTLIITPGTVGPNHYRLELGSGHEAHLRNPAVTDATLRLSLPERQTGQIDVPLITAPSGGYEAHGSGLAFPGDWQMQLT
ncbi:MAG TPA: CopD family protein, partial [Pseudonocardiaceae bacterium]|nr:CopD family protein [Pseudonocardiaceae bacterium]